MTNAKAALLLAVGWSVALGSVRAAPPPALPSVLVDPFRDAEVTLEAGRPTHVVFLATWCSDCLEEIPRLRDLEDRWGGRGYRLVLVAVATRQDAGRLRSLAEQRDLPGVLLWDRAGNLTRSLGVDGLPTHVLLRADGGEVGRWSRIESGLERAIAATMEEARR